MMMMMMMMIKGRQRIGLAPRVNIAPFKIQWHTGSQMAVNTNYALQGIPWLVKCNTLGEAWRFGD